MIEFLNNTFGIKNEISVPLLVSLIVFITGVFGQLFYKLLANFYSRKRNRSLFRNLVSEILTKSSRNSKYLEKFYQSLKIDHNERWYFVTTPITYLDLVYMQDYLKISYAFRVLFFFKNKTKIGVRSFHKIWSIFESLKITEKNINEEFKSFIEKLNEREELFSSYLKEIKTLNDKLFQPYVGKKIHKSVLETDKKLKYIFDRNQIITEWVKIKKDKGNTKFAFYENLIKPLTVLNNKNQDLEITIDLNRFLINAKHQYEEMIFLIETKKVIFYNYYRNYRYAFKVLEKCLKIIK